MNVFGNLLELIRVGPGRIQQPSFEIPQPSAPTPTPTTPAPTVPAPAPAPADGGFSLPNIFQTGPSASFTGQDWLILSIALLITAVGFFFIRGGIQNALIRGRAAPAGARAAGWAWWMFAVVAVGVVVAGFVGEQWSNILFAAIGGGFALVLLLVAVFMTISAASKR